MRRIKQAAKVMFFFNTQKKCLDISGGGKQDFFGFKKGFTEISRYGDHSNVLQGGRDMVFNISACQVDNAALAAGSRFFEQVAGLLAENIKLTDRTS